MRLNIVWIKIFGRMPALSCQILGLSPPHTGIRLDADVLDWFKSQGKGWQTRINAVLRSYFDHHTPS